MQGDAARQAGREELVRVFLAERYRGQVEVRRDQPGYTAFVVRTAERHTYCLRVSEEILTDTEPGEPELLRALEEMIPELELRPGGRVTVGCDHWGKVGIVEATPGVRP